MREEHKLTLQDAIRKFSALPAQKLGLTDRGVLKQGMWADITVFDPQKIRDVATFEQPMERPPRANIRCWPKFVAASAVASRANRGRGLTR